MKRIHRRWSFAFSLAFAAMTMLPAQERTERQFVSDPATGQLGVHATSIPLDAPIDPASYHVGPGDLFSVSISTVPPQTLLLTVTAQGTLMIPLIGEVAANGKTLVALQREIVSVISKRYLNAAPSVSLVAPRKIVVRVRGAGVFEGSYVASASDRVQMLLARGDIRRTIARPDAVLREIEREPVPVLRRSIRIFREGRDPIIVDLERFEATHLSTWSPYLQEGDEVVFTSAYTSKATVSVGGAVVLPGTFEWKPGDRVCDLLQFAKGINDHAVPESVQVLRSTGSVEWHSATSEAEVHPGDRLVVQAHDSPSNEALVSIEGAVVHPGKYPIVASSTRLSEVVALAGGVTAEAMIHGTSVYRRAPMGEEQRLLLLTAERGSAALEDTAYVRIETQARLYGERVSTNAARAIAEPSSDENVVLQSGDRIVIPRHTGTVYVFGQVRRPGHQPFKAGAKLSEYVDRAGGLTERAKEDEVSVIKYSSRQWLSPDDATIEEGDMIWVPRVVERDIAYKLSVIGQIAGIVSATATLILLVIQLGK